MVQHVEGRVAIHIIAEELDSSGQPYPLNRHVCVYVCKDVKIWRHQHTRIHAHTGPLPPRLLPVHCSFTEDYDADADTYDDSDADPAAYGINELIAQGPRVS